MTGQPPIFLGVSGEARVVVAVLAGSLMAVQLHLSALTGAIEALEVPGILGTSRSEGTLRLDFDPDVVSASELQGMIEAVDSAMRLSYGSNSGRRHSLRVRFGLSAGPDLGIAAVLAGTSEKSFIRRIVRVAHQVRDLTSPDASPVLGVASASYCASIAFPFRRRAIDAGTLTLSGSGITIAARACYTDELVIGAVVPSPPTGIGVGDSVRFRAV